MRGFTGLLILVALFLVVSFRQGIALYVDWLWFQEVGYTQLFARSLLYKLVLAVLSGGVLAALLYINLKIAAVAPTGFRFSRVDNVIELPPPDVIDPLLRRLLLPAALFLGLLAAPQAATNWERLPLFLNATSFNLPDPLFGSDVGFYIFRLAMYSAAYHWLIFALTLALLATAAVYLLYRGIQYGPQGLYLSEKAKTHLLILIALILLLKAVGYLLDSYELVYSSRGAAFGASYTDIYAILPALRILTVLALVAAALCVLQISRSGFRYLIGGVGALVLVHAVGLNLYPSLIQRFHVIPNEVEAEKPFIERNIKSTRLAYGLDKVESKDFPAEEKLTAADLKRNESTIKNIRLWEHRPLLATYAQLQEIRTYYKFVDVDNDRYMINGTYRQTMLSARELSHQHLPSRIWINEHLTYTHGYGLVFGPVNQVTPEGLPEFFVKDIPPVVTIESLKITRPEIYYGELANDYVFVKTTARELDYPAGDQNIYTSYKRSRRGAHRFVLAQAFILGAPGNSKNHPLAGHCRPKPHPAPSPDSGAREKDCPVHYLRSRCLFSHRPRRKAFLDNRRLHDLGPIPLLRTHAPPGNELHSQLAQGRGRCLQWNGKFLPERSRGSYYFNLWQDFPRASQAPGSDARGSARSYSLPAGPVYHSGPRVRDLSHARSAGFLQQRRPPQHSAPNRRRD